LLGDGNVFQRFDAMESFAHYDCRGTCPAKSRDAGRSWNPAFRDDGDAGLTSGGSGSFWARSARGNL
jgi:hypothetical protein